MGFKHGLCKHSLHSVWRNMKYRCYKESSKDYKNYGARVIIICSEWKNDFKTFYNWAIDNGWKPNLTIDRINNDGDYEPNNCRFVTRLIQASNRRPRTK